MLKKICYETKNLLALIPNYELKSIKTHYYDEDGDYDKEEFYLVNNNYKIKRVTTTCSPFCFGPTVYFEDNSCVELFYENDGWFIDMRGEALKCGIFFVHELQHLFFGLGIKNEIKV